MSSKHQTSSALGPVILRYLSLKKALGRRYDTETGILLSLDAFLLAHEAGSSDLGPGTFADWCRTLARLTPGVRRNWMRVVRNLCLYRRRTEPGCFVPDAALFPSQHQSVQPYIFTEAEIVRLIAATRGLGRTHQMPIRPETFDLAIVLLYTTGLRRRELVRLTVGDYDPQEQTLLIRQTKFHKSRYLPLSADGVQKIQDYLHTRRTHGIPTSPDMPLLWNGKAGFRCYSGGGFWNAIRRLLKIVGICKPNGRPPRVHDFRWTFAVHALLRWYRSGADVQAKLPLLATFMGHVSISSTQYYLPLVESLSMAAGSLFAKHYGKLIVPLPTQKGGER